MNKKKISIFLDSWGSDLEDLKGKNKTDENVLFILSKDPMVSTFTMSEHYRWLEPIIKRLIKKGLVEEIKCEYPWHKYEVIK